MSVARMNVVIRRSKLAEKDKTWFLRWGESFARFQNAKPHQNLVAEPALVIEFLIEQKNRGKTAWQRLQAVRAIEFYRTDVLKQREPTLDEIRQAGLIAGGIVGQLPLVVAIKIHSRQFKISQSNSRLFIRC